MDFLGKGGKGNKSKSKGKAIILKGPLPVAEVYGALWLPLGPCGPPAAQRRGDRLPFTRTGNRIQCDDKPAL